MTDRNPMLSEKRQPPELQGDITDSAAQRSLDRIAKAVGSRSMPDFKAVDPSHGGPEGDPGPLDAFPMPSDDAPEIPLAHAGSKHQSSHPAAIRIPDELENPIPMLLHCPMCCKRHIDVGIYATKPHHSHACQYCGHVWRPAIVPTVGVQFLPGFRNNP